MKRKIIIIICCLPVVFIIEMYALGFIAMLLTQANDAAVLVGVVSISVWLFIHYLVIKRLLKKKPLNNKKEDEKV